MKKFTSIRLVCMIVAILMAMAVFAACAQNNDDQPSADTTTVAGQAGNDPANPSDGNTSEGNGDEVVDDGLDPNGLQKDTLPADLRFDGKTITLLYWEDVEHEEFRVEEQTGDNVGDAIFYRNLTIEDRLGITMDFVSTNANADNVANWNNYVLNAIQSGNGVFDVMAAYSLSIAASATKGYCY